MTNEQYRFADYCINKLISRFPHNTSLDYGYDIDDSDEFESYDNAESVIEILLSEDWIEEVGSQYKLNPKCLTTIETYHSYSNTDKYIIRKKEREEKKIIYDFHTAKWKYHTFGGSSLLLYLVEDIVPTTS